MLPQVLQGRRACYDPVMVLHVIGASGRSGAALCRSLADDGVEFVPIVRHAKRWRETGIPGEPVVADLRRRATMKRALQTATIVVSCAHARHVPVILDAAPDCQRFIFLGSTRKFTKWPDEHALGVLAGEAAFRASDRFGVMLHPTMIYGATGEDNVQRLAGLLRRLPVVPLPGGGRNLLRPIHQDDVTRSLRAAIRAEWHWREAVVIAGADKVTYAEFVRAVAEAAGLPPPRIIAVPGRLLRWAAPITRVLPGVPRVRPAEVRRLMEDKTFGIEMMQRLLGVSPIGLREGLARTFVPDRGASG
jgi:nucleoside-diphosphate-sugar epimerase